MKHILSKILIQGKMVSLKEQNSIYDIRISTVVPGFISGNNKSHELTAMDLTMKMHYLRFVYYFRTPPFHGLTTMNIKNTMFVWLSHAYIPCGRFRRAASGRPFIKCNDCGIRIIEANCHWSLDEWLESRDDSRHKLLVPKNVIGPDLSSSPLVMIQLTKFKCGAISVGMNWSHVLGNVFSAVAFIKLWAEVNEYRNVDQPLTMVRQQTLDCNIQNRKPSLDPFSVKRVNLVGDLWSTSCVTKMETFSLYISMSELTRVHVKIHQEKDDPQVPPFECICVVIWNCLGKIRHGSGPQVVTVCKNDLRHQTEEIITNKSQTIGVVKSDIPIAECNLMQLGLLMMNPVDERMKIEEAMENDNKLSDFLIYGANLTFVDLSDASFYEVEVGGHKPVYANCIIDNIDDEGVVLVLPTPKGCFDGRIVNITLPENQMVAFKAVLKEDWHLE